MDCSRIDSRLDEWMDGLLPDDQLDEIEAHAAGCPECAKKLRATRQLREMLTEMPDELDVPLEVQAKWRNAVKTEARKGAARRLYRFAGAAAAVLVVAFGAVFAFRSGPMNPKAMLSANSAMEVEQEETAMGSASAVAAIEADGQLVGRSVMDDAPAVAAVESDGQATERQAMSDTSASQEITDDDLAEDSMELFAMEDSAMDEVSDESFAPMQEIEMTVGDLDKACARLRDLASEYEGSIDEQRFEANGVQCANLYVDLPYGNAGEFLEAALKLGAPDDPEISIGDGTSLLMVLKTE